VENVYTVVWQIHLAFGIWPTKFYQNRSRFVENVTKMLVCFLQMFHEMHWQATMLKIKNGGKYDIRIRLTANTNILILCINSFLKIYSLKICTISEQN